MDFVSGDFEWDPAKEESNILKHGIAFKHAAKAFTDPNRKVYGDRRHSGTESRFFCLGKVDGAIVTVRFVYRGARIRIIGAGFWRKGARLYEAEAGP